MLFSSVPGTALAAPAAADRQALYPPTHIVSSKANFTLLPLILPMLPFCIAVTITALLFMHSVIGSLM